MGLIHVADKGHEGVAPARDQPVGTAIVWCARVARHLDREGFDGEPAHHDQLEVRRPLHHVRGRVRQQVRKPSQGIATALGGGYIASGAAEQSRLPKPHLPPGLRLDSLEGAGEVQTPLLGQAARVLEVGDRVYFRHAKAGELCERFNSLYLVEGGEIVDEVPTYRGEGQCFL